MKKIQTVTRMMLILSYNNLSRTSNHFSEQMKEIESMKAMKVRPSLKVLIV